jgi:hypothetical protein
MLDNQRQRVRVVRFSQEETAAGTASRANNVAAFGSAQEHDRDFTSLPVIA